MRVTRMNPEYLPLDTTLGDLHAESNLTNNTSPPFFVTMDAFADGGTLHWTSLANAKAAVMPSLYMPWPSYTAKNSAAIAANGGVQINVSCPYKTDYGNDYMITGVAAVTANNANLVSRGFDVDGITGGCNVKTYWRNVGTAQIAASAVTISAQIMIAKLQ